MLEEIKSLSVRIAVCESRFETPDQLAELRALGLALGQGYRDRRPGRDLKFPPPETDATA